MVTLGEASHKECIDSERNQGRAPNMDWLDHDRLGFNYRLSDVASALGVAQLERLDELLAGRRRVAGLYGEALAQHGVPSKPYFPAIHLMSFYRERFGHREGEFPVCEDVATRSIALPFFPRMAEGQVARVVAALRGVLGQ